jgi:hypothetical protein
LRRAREPMRQAAKTTMAVRSSQTPGDESFIASKFTESKRTLQMKEGLGSRSRHGVTKAQGTTTGLFSPLFQKGEGIGVRTEARREQSPPPPL